MVCSHSLTGVALGEVAQKPRRRGWLRSNRREPSWDAEPVSISGAPGGLYSARVDCFGEISELRLWASRKCVFQIVLDFSVSDGLPQWRSRSIEETVHPMALAAGVVIFASRFGRPGFCHDRWRAALADVHVAALISGLQLAVKPEFHAQSSASHSCLHLRSQNLIAAAGEREGIVVADHPLVYVTENSGQILVCCERSMMIGEVRDRPREMRIPLWPILSLQKRIRVFQRRDLCQTQMLCQTILGC